MSELQQFGRKHRNRGVPLFWTESLLHFAAKNGRLVRSFPRWAPQFLEIQPDVARQTVIRRLKSPPSPHAFDRLRADGRYTPREHALISLLSGSFPSVDDEAIESAGVTVAEVIDRETKYMRKYATQLECKDRNRRDRGSS